MGSLETRVGEERRPHNVAKFLQAVEGELGGARSNSWMESMHMPDRIAAYITEYRGSPPYIHLPVFCFFLLIMYGGDVGEIR